MRIYIARHGQTEWNTVYRWQGSTDIPLDETGLSQAKALAEKLKGVAFDHIYASPLQRAAVTAQIAAKESSAAITYWDSLKEISLGPWEGKTGSEISREYPEQYAQWTSDPTAQVDLAVESYFQVQQRAYDSLEKILASGYKTVLVVSHGAWIRALMCKILNIPLHMRTGFQTGNTGLNIVEYKPPGDFFTGFTVVTLNDMSHIE